MRKPPPKRKPRALIANQGWTLRLSNKKNREIARAILSAVGIAALDNASTELSIIPMENELLKTATLAPWFDVADGPQIIKKLAELWRKEDVGRPDRDAETQGTVPLKILRGRRDYRAGRGGFSPTGRRPLFRDARPEADRPRR